MKQTFTIEIETLGNQSALRDFQIMAALKNSFDEFFDGNARTLSAKETTVEQSVEPLKNQEETPKNIVQLDYSPSEGYSVKYTREEQEESSCYEDERALDYMEIARTNKPSKFEW